MPLYCRKEKKLKTLTAVIVVLLASLAVGQSAKVMTWDPNNIAWQSTDPDGSKWAVLEGDKDTPGKSFTYAFLVPAGHWEHHSHNQDARVAVLSGALKVAVGPTLDKDGAKTYPVGTFLFVPANVEHTMGADVDTICIGTAMGPWKTQHDEGMHHHQK